MGFYISDTRGSSPNPRETGKGNTVPIYSLKSTVQPVRGRTRIQVRKFACRSSGFPTLITGGISQLEGLAWLGDGLGRERLDGHRRSLFPAKPNSK